MLLRHKHRQMRDNMILWAGMARTSPSTLAVRIAIALLCGTAVPTVVQAQASARDGAEADLLGATREARNAGKFDEAEAMARRGMAASPDPVWPLTLALILADQRRSEEALAVLAAPRSPPLPIQEQLAAEGYTHLQAGDDWRALRAYGELLRLYPENAEARSTVAGILERQRGAYGAAALDGVSLRRAADMAAARVRWGAEVRAEDPALRFEGTDRALADLDALLAKLRADPDADPDLVRRVRIDRIIALRDRVRMAEVVAEAEALAPLPAFADQAYADALLYLHRPREALAAYERVLAEQPGKISAAYGRVFALLETEQLNQAVAAADAIAASRPRFVGFRDEPARTPDREYAYAAQLAGQVRLWSNRVADGFTRIDTMANAAPASFSLRQARAGAYYTRGWPRAAEREAEIAASLDPGSLYSDIMLADTALNRNRLDEAKTRSDALMLLAPEDLSVQSLDRNVRARRGWVIDADWRPNFNDGGGSFQRGRGYDLDSSLLSPRVIGPLRLVGRFISASAQPPEGPVTRHQIGGGVRLDGSDVQATLYAAHNWGSLVQTSFGADVSWQLDDHWSLSAAADSNSLDTPIRALLADISGDSARIGVRWRQDERLDIATTLRWLAMSDGNDRVEAGASLVSQLHAAAHLVVRGRVDLYGSTNSKPGGPYFAPEADVSLTAGVSAEHIAWRRYQRMLTQVLSVDAGVYDQRGYGAGWIGTFRYEHRWRQDPWTEIVYGIGLQRRIYDGAWERNITLNLGLRQHF
jgi:biofilm PGA synthesis protein PgaA